MVNWLIRLIRKIKNRKGEYEEMAQDTNISTIKGVYVNREISWLKFNERVLEEAQNENSPLCEKLSFLAIYQSNLDEFFMVRVGSLEDQKLLTGDQRENKTKLSPQEQIDAILENVTKLNAIKDNIYENLMKDVETEGFRLVRYADLSKADAKYLDSYFAQEILPLLSVMIVGRKQPFPFLKNREIYALAILERKGKKKLGIIPCESGMLPRLVALPGVPGTYILLEELILHYAPGLFKGYKVQEKTLMRITRNADIDVSKVYDEDLNYRDQMEQVVKLRKKLAPVRIEFTRDISQKMVGEVCDYCELDEKHVFYSKSPLDLSFVFQIQDKLRDRQELFFEKRVSQQSPDLDVMKPLIPQILEKDVLLSYPYESIRPFLNLLQEAARDPKVNAIRMTLYRLAKNSKVVEALVEAAENGKQVEVLVELKARFDEENNIEWSRTLEDAGCHVVYGVDGLKVHSKLCLITRKDGGKIQYITQIGTGNYNEKTSRLYTDLSLMTANEAIGKDAMKVFQSILIGNTVSHADHLLVAPECLQAPVIKMIDDEIAIAKNGQPAYIGVKINSLTDKKIIDKLVEASKAGVKVELIVRGICCLLAGIPGETENIQIRSIVGRFLEHSRIYRFGRGDDQKIYIASADFMTRNTTRRVEVAAPVLDKHCQERIIHIFDLIMQDDEKGKEQNSDGVYCDRHINNPKIDSQETLYEESYEAAASAE